MIDIRTLSTQEIMARTAWGENRGGGHDGIQSILNVIVNRANHPTWWGRNLRDVCLKPMQFDCWNTNDPNYPKMLNVNESDPVYELAINLAEDAEASALQDITNGATYYYAKSMPKPPYWAVDHKPCADIAGQLFFNDI